MSESSNHIVVRSAEEISEERSRLEKESSSKRSRPSTGNLLLDALITNIRELGKEISCPICCSLLKETRVLPCTHCICSGCAEKFSKASSMKCPICRQTVSSAKHFTKDESMDLMILGFQQFLGGNGGGQETPSFSQILKEFQPSQEGGDVKFRNSLKRMETTIPPYWPIGATPIKTTITTTTPPTIRLGNHDDDSTTTKMINKLVTPPTGIHETKTPPTIQLSTQGIIKMTSPLKVEEPSQIIIPIKEEEGEDKNTTKKEINNTSKISKFRKGQIVTVSRRMGPGENNPGGVAKILQIYEDDTVDVKYTVESRREKRVPFTFLTPGIDTNANSMFGEQEIPPPNVTPSSSSNRKSNKKKLINRQLSFSTDSPSTKTYSIFFTGISDAQKRKMKTIIQKLHGKCLDEEKDPSFETATHLIVSTTENLLASKRSAKFLRAISLGIWIVHEKWLTKSKEVGVWQNEIEYEIPSDIVSHSLSLDGGPKRARETKQNKQPLLFSQYSFGFLGEFWEEVDFNSLVVSCGGSYSEVINLDEFFLLKKEQKLFLIVQDLASALKITTDAKLKKYRDNIVTVQWFLNSLSSYRIVETSHYLL